MHPASEPVGRGRLLLLRQIDISHGSNGKSINARGTKVSGPPPNLKREKKEEKQDEAKLMERRKDENIMAKVCCIRKQLGRHHAAPLAK